MVRGRLVALIVVLAILAIASTGVLVRVVRQPAEMGERLPAEERLPATKASVPPVEPPPRRPTPRPPVARATPVPARPATPAKPPPSAAAMPALAPSPSPAPLEPPSPAPLAVEPSRPLRAPEPDARRHPGGYAVQVGAFGDRANAERLVETIRGTGIDAYVVATDGGAGVFKVWAGAERDRAAAQRIAERLRKELGLSGWVTR